MKFAAVVAFLLVAMVTGERLRDLVCSLRTKVGSCWKRPSSPTTKFSFKPKTGQCEEFEWSGCRGNLNKFDTAEQCQDACAEREVTGCLYNGLEYRRGARFRLECNGCKCAGENEALCTRMACGE